MYTVQAYIMTIHIDHQVKQHEIPQNYKFVDGFYKAHPRMGTMWPNVATILCLWCQKLVSYVYIVCWQPVDSISSILLLAMQCNLIFTSSEEPTLYLGLSHLTRVKYIKYIL